MKDLQFRANIMKLQIQSLFAKKTKESFYNGILIKRSASECRIQDGYPVITIDGDTGRIVKFYNSMWSPGKEKWLDVKLDNRSNKHVHTNNVFVLFIYLPLTKKYYPLSHVCYRYLKPNDIYKIFKFRLTNRGYAMFDSDIKESRDYIAKLRKSRYGASFLQRLEELGYKIVKN
jgi:hypothetical protein